LVNKFALPGSRPHYTRDRTYDSKHVKLDLTFDLERGRVHGKAYNTLAAINDGLRHIEFDQVGLVIESVRVDGRDCGFYTTDEKLHVDLGRPLREGEEVTVEIQYWAEPRKGLYFIRPDGAYPNRQVQAWSQGEDEDNRFWFPCFDSPNDRITSELIARVPQGFQAISNGRLLDVRAEDGYVIYHWVQEVPHVSYLISVVVGRFSELRDEVDGIPVLYYVPRGREEDGWRTFRRTTEMLRFYSERLDYRYPYPKYAQVAVEEFIYGGMENTSATTLTDRALLDERAAIDHDSESLVAHELVHQWFGDLITCKHWSHAWLNEGFATYFENLWVEHSKGHDEFIKAIFDDQEAYFKELSERYSRPIVTRNYESPAELFDRHLYQKAGLVLHTLRFYLGDEQFWKGIRHYVKKYAGQSVDTDDFRKALEEATGRSLEEFFEQWFYRPGHPEFKVHYSWDEQAKMVTLTVEQTQKITGDTGLYNIPVEVAVVTSTGRRTYRVTCNDRFNVFTFPVDERPLTVTFDPDEWVLKGLEFEKPTQMWLYDLRHGRTGERIRAARALARSVDPRVVPALQGAVLHDPFWGVQGEAALALGRIGTEQALQALLQCTDIPNPRARRMVMQALGEFRDERAAEALIAKLEKDVSYFVEAEAARSLGKTRSKRAFERLSAALAKESFQEVIRVGVFDGFMHLGDKAAIPLCKEWSSYGRPREARAAAVRCLGKLGEGSLEVVEYLSGLLKDYHVTVRMAAAEALKALRDERALPHLEAQLNRELDGRVRRRIREAIEAIKEGSRAQLEQLREEVEKIREENRRLKSALARIEAQLSARQGQT